MTQLPLPLDRPPARKPGAARPATIAERFAEFDAEHPEVYELFKRLARKLRRAGHDRGSAEQVFQAIRWEYALATPRDPFKVNDHYRAYYARKLAAELPAEFGSFFEFRQRRGA